MNGIIRAVCLSGQKGVEKRPVERGILIEDFGLEHDAHAGHSTQTTADGQEERKDGWFGAELWRALLFEQPGLQAIADGMESPVGQSAGAGRGEFKKNACQKFRCGVNPPLTPKWWNW